MYEKLNTLLILLCRTISTRKLYFHEHPKVKMLAERFMTQLEEFCEENDLDRLFIGIIEGNLIFEGKNLVGPSIVGRQLVSFAAKMNCGGISFSRDTTEKEFEAFFNLTSEVSIPLESLQKARELLLARDIENIEIAQEYIGPSGPMTKDQQDAWRGQDSGDFLQSPTLIYQALFDAVADAHGNVAQGGDIDVENTRSVSEYMLHFAKTSFMDLMQHVHYPDYDSYTVGHSVRVASLAVFLASSFNWSEEFHVAIGTAGLLHDVGKSRIPDEIMYKPGRLTSDEFAIMKEHARIGAEILLGQKSTTALDISAAWGHHIKHDGTGYPEQPQWAFRHPITALLQCVDVFEALTAARPYKPPLSPHMAYSIMLKDRNSFNPSMLAAFISALGLYPPGTIVKLSDGRKGMVMSVGPKIDRPQVKVTHDAMGNELPAEEKTQVNLSSGEYRFLLVDHLVLAESDE
jgi:putative nucleotidyltransferase with HDIG domain